MSTDFTRKLYDEFAVTDADSGVTYRPWISIHGCPGYKCTHPDGRHTYLYLNASTGSDDGVPTVFVYQGDAGDPGQDAPQCYVVVRHTP